MECLGCQLANGQIETQIVYENNWVTCFLDYNPYNEGHLLILPKLHRAEITQCDIEEAQAIFSVIKLLSDALERAFRPDGITVLQNGGIFNELSHVHVHVIPRYRGQNFADFYIENDDIKKHAPLLSQTKQKLIEFIRGLD